MQRDGARTRASRNRLRVLVSRGDRRCKRARTATPASSSVDSFDQDAEVPRGLYKRSISHARELVELKNHARFINVDIDFMLRRAVPKDASEVKHSQHYEQKQHNGEHGQRSASAAI